MGTIRSSQSRAWVSCESGPTRSSLAAVRLPCLSSRSTACSGEPCPRKKSPLDGINVFSSPSHRRGGACVSDVTTVANRYFPPLTSAREPTWQACSIARVRDPISLHEGTRDLHKPTDTAGTRGTHKDLWSVSPPLRRLCSALAYIDSSARKVTSMVNTMTCFDSSNTGAFPQKPIISSSATTSTAANNPSKPSAFYSRTRSSTPKTSLSSGATTNAQASTVSTVSTTNVRLCLQWMATLMPMSPGNG